MQDASATKAGSATSISAGENLVPLTTSGTTAPMGEEGPDGQSVAAMTQASQASLSAASKKSGDFSHTSASKGSAATSKGATHNDDDDDDKSVASVGLEDGGLEETLRETGQDLRRELYDSTVVTRHTTHGGIFPPTNADESHKDVTLFDAQGDGGGSVDGSIESTARDGGWVPSDQHNRGIGRIDTALQAPDGGSPTRDQDDASMDEGSLDGSVLPMKRRYHGVNDYDEYQFAMPMYERVLEILLTQYGAEHPLVWRVQHAIGLTLLGMGNYTLSHDLQLHVLVHRRRYLGDEHVDSIASMITVADMLLLVVYISIQYTAAAAKRNKNRKNQSWAHTRSLIGGALEFDPRGVRAAEGVLAARSDTRTQSDCQR